MRILSSRRVAAPRDRRRRGFSLLEVMVAMTMLSIVLMSLAKLSTIISVRSTSADIVAKRSAILQLEANKFGAMPFDSLRNFSTTTVTRTLGDLRYSRTLTRVDNSATRSTLTIVITPTSYSTLKDSVIFDRTKPATNTPLCTNC
jgi:prepilin-type N-terminal cleavage/methylation domain-containing protein